MLYQKKAKKNTIGEFVKQCYNIEQAPALHSYSVEYLR